MLQIIAALLQWLPKLTIWALMPAAAILLLLATVRAARPYASLGLLIVTALSGLFLAVGLVTVIVSYGNAILRVFHDFGLIETINFLVTLLPGIGTQLLSLSPILLTTIVSGAGIIFLRRGRNRQLQPSAGTVT